MKKSIRVRSAGRILAVIALAAFFAAAKAGPGRTKKPAPPAKAPVPQAAVLHWIPNPTDLDKYRIVVDVNGNAKVTVFPQTASGTVTELVTLQKIEDMPNGLLRMQVKCKIENSTLSPRILTNLMCSDNSDFLMHPMNPFNLGLYPFPPDVPKKVGEEWTYNTPWADNSQKGKIDAKYKLAGVVGDLAVIDATIHYENDTLGLLKQHQETDSTLKAYIDTKNGKLTKVTGTVKSKGRIPTTSYDLTANVKADLLKS